MSGGLNVIQPPGVVGDDFGGEVFFGDGAGLGMGALFCVLEDEAEVGPGVTQPAGEGGAEVGAEDGDAPAAVEGVDGGVVVGAFFGEDAGGLFFPVVEGGYDGVEVAGGKVCVHKSPMR